VRCADRDVQLLRDRRGGSACAAPADLTSLAVSMLHLPAIAPRRTVRVGVGRPRNDPCL